METYELVDQRRDEKVVERKHFARDAVPGKGQKKKVEADMVMVMMMMTSSSILENVSALKEGS